MFLDFIVEYIDTVKLSELFEVGTWVWSPRKVRPPRVEPDTCAISPPKDEIINPLLLLMQLQLLLMMLLKYCPVFVRSSFGSALFCKKAQ